MVMMSGDLPRASDVPNTVYEGGKRRRSSGGLEEGDRYAVPGAADDLGLVELRGPVAAVLDAFVLLEEADDCDHFPVVSYMPSHDLTQPSIRPSAAHTNDIEQQDTLETIQAGAGK